MNKKNRYIPNPNKLSELEHNFIKKSNKDIELKKDVQEVYEKEKYKGRMISMSDSFYKKLNNYLKCNPTEGNRSSFIVRIIAEYIEKRI